MSFDAQAAAREAGLRGRIAPDSVRVVERGPGGRPVAELPALATREGANRLAVLWEVQPPAQGRAERDYHVYFDTASDGRAASAGLRTSPLLAAMAGLADSSRRRRTALEQADRFWSLEGTATWARAVRRLRLEADGGEGIGLLKLARVPVAPHSAYRVSFRAKALQGEGLLRANLYVDPAHDSEQQEVHVPADGAWRRFEVTAPVGALPAGGAPPAGVRPALRIWAIGR